MTILWTKELLITVSSETHSGTPELELFLAFPIHSDNQKQQNNSGKQFDEQNVDDPR